MDTRKALVTGGSRGIGRAIVERLVADGFSVTLTWLNDEAAATELVKKHNGKVAAVRADLSTVEGAVAAAEELRDRGPFHVIVNNATSMTPIGMIVDTQVDTWLEALTISATAPFVLIKELAPAMPAGGSIVNVSSLNTLLPQAGIAGYCAGKSALESLTQVAAKELASRDITVNAVRPGVTDTDGQRAVNPDDSVREQIAQMTPLGRLGQPADIADVVSFFAGRDSRWVTGQILTVSGGL